MKKRILSLAILLMFTVSSFAQQEITKFMGIPIDGFKKEMIQKLEAKGFEYNKEDDELTGEFNGEKVTLSVQTNNNKVWRIGILDQVSRDESDIIVRYNNLFHQFQKNERYEPGSDKMKTIPQSENISYEMNINHKRYEAVFYQKIDISKMDTTALKEQFKEFLKEQVTSLSEENKKIWGKLNKKISEDKLLSLAVNYVLMEEKFKRTVWFTISKSFGRYRLLMFYENGYNQANGEDL